MKKTFLKSAFVLIIPFIILGLSLNLTMVASAEDENVDEALVDGTSISISPPSKMFRLNNSSVYEDVLSVTNNGNKSINFEVYAAPYSYIYSEESDTYALGFSRENNYTQITRWISVMDQSGNYVERPTFTAQPGETIDVLYRITTPESIPDGGQYAVLFAHTFSDSSDTSGIKTEASPGMVIYGRSENGETNISSEISGMKISKTIEKEVDAEENGQSIKKNANLNHINAFAKVKNTGNLDFNASGILRIRGIFTNNIYYETPENESLISVIPESELTLSDEWEETPSIGFYKAVWEVTAGENTETVEMVVFLMPPSVIIISIIVLTILIIWVIMMVRKRKDRRSRLTV